MSKTKAQISFSYTPRRSKAPLTLPGTGDSRFWGRLPPAPLMLSYA